MKKYDKFHDDLEYVMKAFLKQKEKNPDCFYYQETVDGYKETSSNGITTLMQVLKSMPVAKLKRIISSPASSNMTASSHWGGNEFMTSGYSYKKNPYLVSAEYIKKFNKNRTIKARTSFIQSLAVAVNSMSKNYPKFEKFVFNNGSGLFLYSILKYPEVRKIAGMQRRMMSVLFKEKDARVLRWVVDNLSASNLEAAYKKLEEAKFDEKLLGRMAQDKIIWALKNKIKTYDLDDFLDLDKDSGKITWHQHRAILNCVKSKNVNWNSKRRLEVFNLLSNKIDKYNLSASYNSAYYACRDCMNYLFDFIPKSKYPFLMETGIDYVDNKLKFMMMEEDCRWSS